jgi:hypothetical protein
VPPVLQFRWDAAYRMVIEHPIQHVLLTTIFAFLAGLGVAALAGPQLFHGIPPAIAVMATASSVICTFAFGYILAKALQQPPNGTTHPRKM